MSRRMTYIWYKSHIRHDNKSTMISVNDTTLQQKAANATSTVCEPIAWDDILKHPATRFHPKSVRRYLFNVVEKLNNHLAIWMDGPSICKLRIRRNGTQGGNVDVSVSVWRARQLFPWMVQCQWLENEKKKMLFRNVIEIFLAAKNRKEIYHTPTVSELPLRQSPVIEWLKTQLALPVECCSLKWAGLNPREWLYSSFLEEVKYPEEWNPKKISQEMYSILPSCKPTKRLRQHGISMMYVPSRDSCKRVLDNWIQKYENNEQLRF